MRPQYPIAGIPEAENGTKTCGLRSVLATVDYLV